MNKFLNKKSLEIKLDDRSKYLRKLIREVIRRELDETTTTANVGGYLTPRAFAGKSSVYRKKIKEIRKRDPFIYK